MVIFNSYVKLPEGSPPVIHQKIVPDVSLIAPFEKRPGQSKKVTRKGHSPSCLREPCVCKTHYSNVHLTNEALI